NAPKAGTSVGDLTVEHKRDPMGITVPVPRLSWKIFSAEPGQIQTAYQVLAASSPDKLSERKADMWNSGKVESDQSILVEYGGRELLSRDRCWWSVRVWDKNGRSGEWSEPAYFEMGLLNPSDWKAEWITSSLRFEEASHPAPLFRKEFSLGKQVAFARMYVTALGLYECYLNGEKVGDQVFTPGWTSYEHRLQFQVYDVTSLLLPGNNAAGIRLGNGWYSMFNPNTNRRQEPKDLQALAQIEVVYTDGSSEWIGTGDDWKSSTGAILKSEIYNGEVYDARLEQSGWTEPGFDDSRWVGVRVTGARKDILMGIVSQPVRKIEEITPVEVIVTPGGDTVVDMGQNMVGWCRLLVQAPEGTTITLRHAEVLDKDGNFYTENLRSAKQEVTYICKGGGAKEIYEPAFTFQGFRYVALSGYPGEVTEEVITGVVIHSDLERTGTFSCNDKLINQLQHNIIWGQKGNFLDVPTDCPQRNERLGWTGDAQVFAPTACFNMNSAAFFTKWLGDLAADQHEDGAVPHVIPNVLGRGDAHGWADAATIVPWTVYRYYGDTRILEEQYESMKRWVEYVRGEAGESYLWKPVTTQFGDWLAYATTRSDYPGATTDKDLTASAYFYHSTRLLQKTAEILGKEEDVLRYEALADHIKKAWNNEFVTPNGRLSSNTQTAYVVALSFGLLPEEREAQAAERLAMDVRQFGHITTGFLGTADICHVLTKFGYLEEAYMLIYRKDYPSWLYPVTKGATTIWERWDGIKPDGTFQNAGMNSFNHYAYGAVGDWLYSVVAGIQCDPRTPGFKKIIIKPCPGGGMNDVECSHESPYGTIRSSWKIEEGMMKLKVTIPPNTAAVIWVPSTTDDLKCNGTILGDPERLTEGDYGYHFLKAERGAGEYLFETKL
ncbi:MAG: glycoside hydrolase family 78 protein, partial [Bacteroidales bacterium]|nr:glycoside hydrolase family 78 protein [Bacteroidales bacterium]